MGLKDFITTVIFVRKLCPQKTPSPQVTKHWTRDESVTLVSIINDKTISAKITELLERSNEKLNEDLVSSRDTAEAEPQIPENIAPSPARHQDSAAESLN